MNMTCVELHYVMHKNKMGFEDVIVVEALEDKKVIDGIYDEDDIHHVKAYFREIGWSEYNDDKKEFTFYNPSSNTYDLDTLKLLEYEFRKLFLYIEDNGERTDITPELIEDIHPSIANYLAAELSKQMSIDSKELFNLAHHAANYYTGDKNTSDLMHVPSEVIELALAERFGWSLQEIEGISISKMEKILVTLNQQTHQERAQYNNQNSDVIDEATGMRIVGGQQLSVGMKDAIAHRVKKK